MRNKLLSMLVLLMTATGAWAQAPATYKVIIAEDTEDATNWTISPTEAAKGATVTATYSGTKRVKSVKAVKAGPPLTTPLTLEAITEGTIVVSSPKEGMKYSTDGGDTKKDVSGDITVAIGDKVQFYGTATSYSGTVFGGTAKVKVYGNIMSLVDADFATRTEPFTLTAVETFQALFKDNDKLTDASGLRLPATTLTKSCYLNMFYGCTALTKAPEKLPAESLAENCYKCMFSGCASLTTTPKLPATTLVEKCYFSMFASCTSLTTTPKLPATTLATGCYEGMFCDCTNLTAAPELPATTLVEKCYMNMFARCTSLTTTPKLPATMLVTQCYEGMFNGCTSLTTAYVKAGYFNLGGQCTDMFSGCTATGAKLHTTSDNEASWDAVMPSTWATWTADPDWAD